MKKLYSLFSVLVTITSLLFPVNPAQASGTVIAATPFTDVRGSDPFGIHHIPIKAEFAPEFSFYESFKDISKSYLKDPVNQGACKTLNAECAINESGKDCCAGLTCVPFNDNSGNGKCQYSACTNGATNPPSCDVCPSGQVLVNGACVAACTDPKANNQGQALPCTYDNDVLGCTDPKANNYNPAATKDDGTCKFDVLGCTNPEASNYNPSATKDDGTCKFDILGCIDPKAINYNADATKDDGTCKYDVLGCMDPKATNYNADATKDDGTCKYVTIEIPKTTPKVIPVTGTLDLIAAGIGHTCAVTTSMGLRCWGDNDFGQLGNGTYADSKTPVAVKSIDPRTVEALVAGSKHTCALLTTGDVMCWGLNFSGQLGNGNTINRSVPVKVSGLKGKIVSITAGLLNTCALNAEGQTMCWGDNSMGQFNNGLTTNTDSAVVANVTDVKLISGAYKELQAITREGALQSYSTLPAIPVTGVGKDLALVKGDRFDDGGCALTVTGDVECWGSIKGSAISGAAATDLLTTGQNHGCVQTDEGLVCWGKNTFGQLGDGSQTDSETPVMVKNINSVIALAAGAKHTCAILDPRTIECWGSNEYGQLGNGTLTDSALPVKVS